MCRRCASTDTGVQRSKTINNNMGMRKLGGLFTDGLCTGTVYCSDSWYLKLEREI